MRRCGRRRNRRTVRAPHAAPPDAGRIPRRRCDRKRPRSRPPSAPRRADCRCESVERVPRRGRAAVETPIATSARTAFGRTPRPAPTSPSRAARSSTSTGIPRRCSAAASAMPPIPAPAMMTRSGRIALASLFGRDTPPLQASAHQRTIERRSSSTIVFTCQWRAAQAQCTSAPPATGEDAVPLGGSRCSAVRESPNFISRPFLGTNQPECCLRSGLGF